MIRSFSNSHCEQPWYKIPQMVQKGHHQTNGIGDNSFSKCQLYFVDYKQGDGGSIVTEGLILKDESLLAVEDECHMMKRSRGI